MADTTIEKITFLGATVESFSSSFGFNSSPSSATIGLVEDFDNDDAFDVDNFKEDNLKDQFNAGTGGLIFENGNPGTFDTFICPGENPFKFSGRVTSWRRTNSSSGRKISVQMKDLRVLFSKIPIIYNTDLISLKDVPNSGAIQPDEHNLIDVFGYYGNSIDADWTRDGMSARSVIDAIAFPERNENGDGIGNRTMSFYGQTYTILFDSSLVSNIRHRVPINYRVPIQDTTLAQFLDKVAQECGFDWYITNAVDNENIISIHGLSRFNNADTIFNSDQSSHPINSFIVDRKDRLMSFDIGRELRTDPNDVILFGDKRRTTYAVSEGGGGGSVNAEIFPIFSQTKDGHLIDKMLIPLDNIHTADNPGILNNLPTVSAEKKSLIQNPGSLGPLVDPIGNNYYVPAPGYERVRPLKSRPGYLVTEEMLRAALHSKESWSTVVWYYYYDKGNSSVPYTVYERYDIYGTTTPIGRSSTQTTATVTASSVPENMGIYGPDIDRSNLNGNPWKARLNNTNDIWGDLESKQAIREACYQATLKFAQEYYGKVFTVRLPHSPIYDDNMANEGINQYSLGERNILMEYEITNGSPALLDLEQVIESNPPYHIINNDNKAFTTSNGLLKPRVFFNHDQMCGGLSNFPGRSVYASYEMFDENKSAKVSGTGDHGELLTSGFEFHTTDLSVDHYKFDPRFAVIRLSAPVLLGYGHIRDVWGLEYDDTGRGIVVGSSNGYRFATQPSEKDTSGAAQSFFSWLLRDFTIVNGLTTTHNGVQQPIAIIESGGPGGTKEIDAGFYYNLLHTKSKEWSDKMGLEQKRYIGVLETTCCTGGVPICPELHTTSVPGLGSLRSKAMTVNIPLKWNYYYYGPFSDTFNNWEYKGTTSVIRNTNINPWNFKSYRRMVDAAAIIVENAESQVTTLSYANVEIEGYPELSLGLPMDDGDVSVASSLAGVSFKMGMSGVTTQYNFKTFFGLTGNRLKEELDQVYRADATLGSSEKDKIKIDEILKDIQDADGGSKDNTGKQNPFLAGNNSGSGSSTVDTLVSSRGAGHKGQPSTSAKSQVAVQEAIESRKEDIGSYDDIYYCAYSELYIPIVTNHPTDCEGFVPSVQGIRLDP